MDQSHYSLSREARWRSFKIWVIFIGLVLILCALIGAIAVLGMDFSLRSRLDSNAPAVIKELTPKFFLYGFLGSLMVISVSAAWKLVSAGRDGAGLAQSMGGVEITSTERDPRFKKLHNIVEETALAAAMPTPRVFVLRHETGINAFAAGRGSSGSVIGVTHGAVSCLNRDELSGVIAHEMAHIRNEDVVVNLRAFAMIHGLMAISVLGYTLFRSLIYSRAGRQRRDDGRILLVLLAGSIVLMVIGFLGSIAGRILQASLSREREYLADASAVGYTGNSMGLAGALKKILDLDRADNALTSAVSEETQHMLFVSTSQNFISRLYATHPPLGQRIRRLDSSFSLNEAARRIRNKRDMVRDARSEDKAEQDA